MKVTVESDEGAPLMSIRRVDGKSWLVERRDGSPFGLSDREFRLLLAAGQAAIFAGADDEDVFTAAEVRETDEPTTREVK